ncbi:MAG: phage holin family protein [Flavobacteriaceae bacterium]|nr:phage holin family protein [Flavobacteriaceae bacterium]
MKKLLLLLTILFSVNVFSTDPRLVLLRPTGQKIDGLAEMEVIRDTSQLAVTFHQIAETTVIDEFLHLHDLLQTYLSNTTGKPSEPAYLALTDNQGGYAVKGFVLVDQDRTIEKPESFYVDINKNVLDRPYNSLMSITQLYPHELGHIIYRLLSASGVSDESSKNVNVHFFSLITDYQIAFNEGFAEHLENIARLFETNKEVRQGIEDDTTRISTVSSRCIKGFRKDFKNPLRFGFYKMSMIAWYQPFEDYKRFAYALDGRSKYVNGSLHSTNPKSNLIFRNSGVAYDTTQLRNKVQSMASEGTISTFFSMLAQTDIKNRYPRHSAYRLFLKDTLTSEVNFEQRFSPLQNMFIKYFYVLNKHVSFGQTERTQLIDFIEGYLIEFPGDSEIIMSTYRKAAGEYYSPEMPADLWFMIKDQPHGVLAMDAYAGLSIPVYTFSLNAAEMEDLMMIEGLTEPDATALLNYRDKQFINSYDEINSIKELSSEGKKLLVSHRFDEDYFENLEFPEELNIKSVITAPLKKLGLYSGIYFIALMVVYIMFLQKRPIRFKASVKSIFGFLPLWMVFVLTGLIAAALGWQWTISLAVMVILILISALLAGKKKRKQVGMLSGLMAIVILFSII